MESLPASNTALINTLNNILEAPLHCSPMKSTTLSLPPFLAPLVPVEDVLGGKDFWMDLVTTNTRIEELQLNLTNMNLIGLSYDGGDVQENSTIYEETKLFNESNVEEFCISSDSTICDLTEPFEFREAVNQKKIDDNYLRIGESEITMLFA